MPSTIVEKILARASGRDVVSPGDLVVCRPDQVVEGDLSVGIPGMWYMPREVFDPDRIVVMFDHLVPAPNVFAADAMATGRRFAARFGLRLSDVGHHGIIHVVLAEMGLALPGELLTAGDSHTCAAGAFNCAGRGVGGADLMVALVKGSAWYPVGATVRYEFRGRLRPGVTGKDVFFFIAQNYGSHNGMNMEFGGAGMGLLSLDDRRTIATMCAEVSAEFAIFECDDATLEYVRPRAARAFEPVFPDLDAEYEDVRTIDLGRVEPHVIFPDFVAKNGVPVSELPEGIRIDQAFLGSCANGKLEDLRLAAAVVRGRQVAPGVRFIVTPASQAIYRAALAEGIVGELMEAGAVVTSSTCGACFGGHMGVLGADEVCITASTRNFKGRMGSASAKIYMGSPATVAASAVAGEIVDPRPFLPADFTQPV